MDLTEFLTARLDEDERELVKDPPHGLGYANLGAQIRREITAKRAILDIAIIAIGSQWPELRDLQIRHLASAYSDHPDYDPAWKPA